VAGHLRGGKLEDLFAILYGKEKAAAMRKFFRRGRNRRQDHGTRGNSHRHQDDDPWLGSAEADAEMARKREVYRHRYWTE